ncbi:NAD-dependent epimerase/dehydratase family protein [Streptomyces mobaraensis NBRC 13819 = DSM 40847]|uniref:NAD-dependent epimerase/dehydratase n=2 Tax=Streptomyces mobaraensis TaxID=35621 RepID=A0A5N5WBT0_STRMB|nr:NAD-dependent epimerase/dehydratase family protein [Streptomyces mobaraensis]EME97263.1 NAD-dependent epimerase/dehydratase [Streptomyces mobaraensis NBRC 13819 = DSM 40847]KAB7847731.1 NAD-dependent epimerase/dehydratase [Streptomyces mobaraensis]QTT74955.1 NAD-dependent epimerase/dehydratase family protein [Streptomyces mobaraensis NBRC 13819 = DSM 40847]
MADERERVLVAGGTGFVGRRLCADLVAAGAEVAAVARRAPDLPPPCRILTLDVTTASPGELAGLIDSFRPHTLVNAIGSNWGIAERDLEANCAVPARRLMAALRRTTCRPYVVHLGSVLEYGPTAPGETTRTATPARPTTTYGKAKLAASRAVLEAAAEGVVEAGVLRIGNVAGPGTPAVSLLGRVAGRLAEAVARDTLPAVVELSQLRAHRDYVDVRDVSEAVLAATRARIPGLVVPIGRGEAVAVRWLVDLLVEVSGVPAEVRELPAATTGTAGDDWVQVDPEPARRLLGWTAVRSLRESVSGLWDETLRAHGIHDPAGARR